MKARIGRLLSHDYPGNPLLNCAVLGLVGLMLIAPVLGGGLPVLNLFAKIAIYTVLVGSFDLLLGYAGIISFAHTMFYGIGAYGVALALISFGPGWLPIVTGIAGACFLSVALATIIGLFSLRVRAIFFAMITLAVAMAFSALVTQSHGITGGHDGLLFRIPRELTPAFRPFSGNILGISVNGTTLCYFMIVVLCAALFLTMLRIVNSPFGRVLQALRENEFRTEALGFSVLKHRLAISGIAAFFACIAGGLNAVWLRFVSPDVTLHLQVMLDILLIIVIGGMGTLYGSLMGAGVFIIAENYLKQVISSAAGLADGIPFLAILLQPERWMLWLGILFVLCIYYFPGGIVGRLRASDRK